MKGDSNDGFGQGGYDNICTSHLDWCLGAAGDRCDVGSLSRIFSGDVTVCQGGIIVYLE